MGAKRTLRDLYVVGKELVLDDGGGSVEVWIQKLNPVDHRYSVTKADASRARLLAVRSTPDSDDYMALLNGVLDFDKAQLIDLLTAVESVRISPHKRAQIAAEKEWATENYFDGLEEIWDSEMKDRFIDDPEDTEAKRVKDELDRFIVAVADAVTEELETYRDGLGSMGYQELSDLGVDYEVRTAADMAWIQTYYRWEVYFGVRDPANHRVRYFADAKEIDELSGDLVGILSTAFRELTVDPTEGKELAASPPSSALSAPSATAETPASSGPKAA